MPVTHAHRHGAGQHANANDDRMPDDTHLSGRGRRRSASLHRQDRACRGRGSRDSIPATGTAGEHPQASRGMVGQRADPET